MLTVNDVTINGIEMRYAKFGTGKKNLIILPGISVSRVTDSAKTIQQMYRDFCEDYTVYLFDRRSNLPKGYTIHEMAEDTACVIKSLGIEKAYFYGVSQGGMMTLDIACRHPELVGAIVIASSCDKAYPAVKEGVTKWVELAKAHNRTELAKEFVNAIYSPETVSKIGNAVIALSENYTDKELDNFAILAEAIIGYDLSREIENITLPTFVLASMGDKVMGAEPSENIAKATNAQLYIYPDCYGHAVYDEAPDFLNRIKDFFDFVS